MRVLNAAETRQFLHDRFGLKGDQVIRERGGTNFSDIKLGGRPTEYRRRVSPPTRLTEQEIEHWIRAPEIERILREVAEES